MIGLAYNEIMTKTFFSMKNSKTPMISALVSMAANIAMAYFFYAKIGVGGLALATAGGSTVNAALNFAAYHRQKGKLFDKKDIAAIVKTFVCGIAMAAVVLCLSKLTESLFAKNVIGYILHGAICGGAGMIVYIVLAYVIGIEYFENAVGGVFGGKK